MRDLWGYYLKQIASLLVVGYTINFNCKADIAHENLATRVLQEIPHNWIRSYMEL